MRTYDFRLVVAATALTGAVGLTAAHADAGDTVAVLVLKEHGLGSAARAQPSVEKLVSIAASQMCVTALFDGTRITKIDERRAA